MLLHAGQYILSATTTVHWGLLFLTVYKTSMKPASLVVSVLFPLLVVHDYHLQSHVWLSEATTYHRLYCLPVPGQAGSFVRYFSLLLYWIVQWFLVSYKCVLFVFHIPSFIYTSLVLYTSLFHIPSVYSCAPEKYISILKCDQYCNENKYDKIWHTLQLNYLQMIYNLQNKKFKNLV